jgi:hypothetical protein
MQESLPFVACVLVLESLFLKGDRLHLAGHNSQFTAGVMWNCNGWFKLYMINCCRLHKESIMNSIRSSHWEIKIFSSLETKWLFGPHILLICHRNKASDMNNIANIPRLEQINFWQTLQHGDAVSHSRTINALLHQIADQIDIHDKEIARTITTQLSVLIASFDSLTPGRDRCHPLAI